MDPHESLEPEDAGAGQSGGRAARSLTARGATDASGAVRTAPGERGRFSAPRKAAAILRMVRGESLDALSRELGVTAATLSDWREKFLAGGQAALKAREGSPQEDEILRLKAMVGDLAMRNELLLERSRLAEAASPFPWRRSRS